MPNEKPLKSERKYHDQKDAVEHFTHFVNETMSKPDINKPAENNAEGGKGGDGVLNQPNRYVVDARTSNFIFIWLIINGQLKVIPTNLKQMVDIYKTYYGVH